MSRHKVALVWVIVVLGSGFIEAVFGPVEEFLAKLSPIAIWQVGWDAVFAVCATIAASLVAWISALAIGGFLGMVSATAELASQSDSSFAQIWGITTSAIRRFFSVLYVVPLVLTLSLAATILLNLHIGEQLSLRSVALSLIVVSGVTLSGQRIFIALDGAVRNTGSDELMTASSLYLGLAPNPASLPQRARRIWNEVRYLIACRISLLVEAVEQAFHLAVVGVVILETVVGLRVYDLILPASNNATQPWGGGIGRIIVDAQNMYDPTTAAGALWLILIADSAIVWIIREAIARAWITPYRGAQ